MGDQRGFHFERAHPVARRDDDVVVTALEPEVALLILADMIAGGPPLAVERLLVQVAAEEARDRLGADLELALDDTRLDPRQGPAHRAVTCRIILLGAHAADRPRLGLSVAVADAHPHRLAEGANDLRVERLTRRDH